MRRDDPSPKLLPEEQRTEQLFQSTEELIRQAKAARRDADRLMAELRNRVEQVRAAARKWPHGRIPRRS